MEKKNKRNFIWFLNMLNFQLLRVNDKFNISALLMLFSWAVGNTIWFEFYAHTLINFKILLFVLLIPAFILGTFLCYTKQSNTYIKEFEEMTAEETSKWGWITFGVSLFVLCFLAWTFLRT